MQRRHQDFKNDTNGRGCFNRNLLRFSGIAAGVFSFGGVFAENDNGLSLAPPSNVLLVIADDLGVELGCYGDGQALTPHLDAFAATGVRFETAWVTTASCSPSRGSIHTGLYPHQSGLIGLSHRGYSMHEEFPTSASLLHEHGYRTGMIGKFHIAPESAAVWDFLFTDFEICYDERDVATMVKVAEGIIKGSAEDPFFLVISFVDPHAPFSHQLHGLPEEPQSAGEIDPFPWIGINTEEIREQTAGYYNSVARLDAGFGLLMEVLKESDHYGDTLIIFIGDHGPPFTRAKTTCYNMALRIPLIISYPRYQKPSQVRTELVSTVDLMPTILDAAGVDAPENLPGHSLVPLVRGDTPEWREYLFGEHHAHQQFSWFPRRTLRDDRYQLILNLTPEIENPILGVDGCVVWDASRDPRLKGTTIREVYDRLRNPPAVELFDLKKDPSSFYNLAEDPAYQVIRQRLETALLDFRGRSGDPFLDPDYLHAQNDKHRKLREDHLKTVDN